MSNPVPLLRTAALVEAVSYLVLVFVAMPLKHVWGLPMAVKVIGWLHGLLFVWFCWALVRVVHHAPWPPTRIVGVFVAALLPIVPFFLDRWMKRWVTEWRPRNEGGA